MKAVFSLVFLFCLLHLSQGEEQEGPGESDQVAIGQESLPSLNREERSAEPRRKKNCKGKKGKNCKRRAKANRKASRKSRKGTHTRKTKCKKGKKGKKCRQRSKANRKKKCGKKCRRKAKKAKGKKKCNKKNGQCGRQNYPSDTTTTTSTTTYYAPDPTTSTTTKAPQTCEECQQSLVDYGKDASLARTQVNKGKRIPKLLNRVEDRANKSATVFAETIDALYAATVNGTTCNGTAIPANATVNTILSTLKNCSSTVPKICNASSVNTTVDCDITVVEAFGENYKKCLFPGAGGNSAPAYVCACLDKLTRPARPGCIPSGFDAAEKAAKLLNTACNKASTAGSWGECRWAMKAAQPYLIGGSMQCQAPPTAGTATTTAASAGRRNQLLRNQFRGFLKRN